MKVHKKMKCLPRPEGTCPRPVPARIGRRYAQLQQALSAVGFFRRGSLVQIYERCGKKGCGCLADPPRLHGPYMRWTRKVAGKTVSVRVRAEHVAMFQEWIANSRRLDQLLAEMQEVSMRATEKLLQETANPEKRKSQRHAQARGSRLG